MSEGNGSHSFCEQTDKPMGYQKMLTSGIRICSNGVHKINRECQSGHSRAIVLVQCGSMDVLNCIIGHVSSLFTGCVFISIFDLLVRI